MQLFKYSNWKTQRNQSISKNTRKHLAHLRGGTNERWGQRGQSPFRRLSALLLLLAIPAVTQYEAKAQPQSWVLGDQWSDTQNPSGAWSYTDGNNNLLPLQFGTPGGGFTAGQVYWGTEATAGGGGPNIFQSTGPEGRWLSNDVIAYVGSFAYSIGTETPAVSWTSPINGNVSILGDVWYAYGVAGIDWRYQRWYLLLNGGVITSSGRPFGDSTGDDRSTPFLFSTGTAGSNALQNIQIQIGDVITLVITMDGTSYQGWTGGAVGIDFSIVSVQSPPSIQVQPVSQILSTGGNATFSVQASGSPTPAFQWQFNGTNIVGATNTNLFIPAAGAVNVGIYNVVLSNSVGTLVSSNASLSLQDLHCSPVLVLSGPSGASYDIQYATVLGATPNWTTITNIVLTSSQPYVYYVDYNLAISTQQGYYRAILH